MTRFMVILEIDPPYLVTLPTAAGFLEVLMWAREHSCPWNASTLCAGRCGWVPEAVEVGARAPLPVGPLRL